MDSRSADTPAERLLKIRQTLVDRIWRGLFFVALVGAPASVSRFVATGWLHLYSFHLAVALLVVFVYLYRARIPFVIKSALMLLCFWGVGLAGLFTLGFLGPGYWWLVMSSLLVSTLYSWRAGIATAALVSCLIAGLLLLPISHYLRMPFAAMLPTSEFHCAMCLSTPPKMVA
jgi:hypothetical protein